MQLSSLFSVILFLMAGATSPSVLFAQELQSTSQPSPNLSTAGRSSNDVSKTLHDLFDSEWEFEMQQYPERASSLGDRRWNDRWSDRSLGTIHNVEQHNAAVLDKLKSIDRAQLPEGDRLNYDLFRNRYQVRVEGSRFHLYFLPVEPRGGIQTLSEFASSLRFETVKDYRDWIERLRSFPVPMDQTIALMREGMRERLMYPRIVMEKVTPQIDNQIVNDLQKSPFYKPFEHFPTSIAASERERLAKEAQTAIANQIVPAFRKFREFYVTEYLPACLDKVGFWQLPNGDELYAYLVRVHTTTSLTPQRIHEIGLREVDRIRGEMQQVMEKVGFRGSRQEFFKFLRTDLRFYYSDPKDLFAAYQATAKTIDPRLIKVFKVLPRMPYGVEPIPAETAPVQTTAYYSGPAADGSRAGRYFVNLYKPEARPKWEMMTLTLHEAVPGHHLQIALAQEQGEIPKFRRYGGYTAFTEGWGLYAESLGDDMGLFDDPYSKFGQLTYDMWRAVRLVVDTGMHAMKWDRQRAIDFFLENAPKTELDVVNEIDRYIAWPGQALAYKIGQLKIKELRAKTSRELGTRFDVREFHDVVLGSGAVPLSVLEQQVNDWLESANKNETPPKK